MDERQLDQYITQQLSQGYSELDVRGFLQQRGWQPPLIDAAFRRLHAAAAAPSPVYAPPAAAAPTAWSPPLTTAPATHTYGQHRMIKILSLVGVLLVLAVAAFLIFTALHHKTAKPTTAQPALSSTDIKRQHDVAIIRNAVATYKQSSDNTLPQTTAAAPGLGHDKLFICGSSCSAGTPLEVTLSHYANTPAAVSFREYAAKLEVPNADTVYIVNNAVCNAGQTGLGAQASGKAAVLYALQSNHVTRRCANV